MDSFPAEGKKMAETYKTLDQGPVEERVKVVVDALCSGRWTLMVETETGNWLVCVDSSRPSMGVPDDVINYMKAQDLFTAERPWRLS
jgi:hypothetical protein